MEIYENERSKVVKPRGRAHWLMMIVIVVLVLFVSISAVGLSIGAIVKTENNQESNQIQIINVSDVEAQIKNFTESQAAALKSLQDLYQELSNKVIEVQMENNIQVQELNRSVSAALKAVESVRNESRNSKRNELDLTAGCSVVSSVCSINHNNFQGVTLPASQTCETEPETLEVEGLRNFNIYCSIDNSGGEVNPITSTLNIYNGEASCLCDLVALTQATSSPECRLTIHRCPETIRLNTANMH